MNTSKGHGFGEWVMNQILEDPSAYFDNMFNNLFYMNLKPDFLSIITKIGVDFQAF